MRGSAIGGTAKRVLMRTPLKHWHRLALLVAGDDEGRIMSRGDLAAWCRANDLPSLAAEAEGRRVPPGSMLALLVTDAGPIFRVLGAPREASPAPARN